jgi:hypothetical protein
MFLVCLLAFALVVVADYFIERRGQPGVGAIAVPTPFVATPSPNRPASPTDDGDPDAKVWVNTASGVYHCPGTQWYGNTKQGEYMTQKEARVKGNRPAYGNLCQ